MVPLDYTSFNGGPGSAGTSQPSKRWWTLSDDQMSQGIAMIVNSIAQGDSARQTQYQTSVRLYGNLTLLGVNGLSFSKITSAKAPLRDRISYNVIQSSIDTVQAKMAKNKPKPLFLTSGGDWKLQRRAKKLDKFVDGIFYENQAYALGLSCFRDGAIVGDGIVHVFERHGRVTFERVLASELYVDEMEAFYGQPRQLHRAKNVDRAVLADLFPDKKALIEPAKNAATDLIGVSKNVADQVTVVESWHLPSGPDATDGMHVISIEEGILLKDDKWNKDRFPFAFFKWCPRFYGFWGQGAAEQMQNIQLEINKLLWVIQRSMHMQGTFKIFMKNGSKIVKEHFSNDIGAIIAGEEMPQYLLPPAVQPEIYAHLQTLKAQAFEQVGVSQLSAASKKPEGLDSGKALREFNDIESDRFQTIGQAYECFYLEIAKLAIGVAKEIFESEGKYSVSMPGKKFLETIDWKDIKLEDDEYVMKVFPVSSLPQDPAGRLATITEYMQAGFISPRIGRRLLDFPDLEAAEDLGNSQEDWLHEVFEKMIEDGQPYQLEPYDDASMAHELALEYYSYGKVTKVPEDRLQLLRDFIDNLAAMQALAAAPPPGEAAGGTTTPQAVPSPTPVSNMIPNVAA